jgi:signal transduction histidine kinase
MPSQLLERNFASRMLPLAIAAGLIAFSAPPLFYRFASISELKTHAEIYAAQLASSVEEAAEQEPFFWRYNTSKIMWSTSAHRLQEDIGTVTIVDCAGKTVFDGKELELGTGNASGPTGWAAVKVGNRNIAWVRVIMDTAMHRKRYLLIMLFSGCLGAVLGLLLFWFPRRVVRRQAGLLTNTIIRLEKAEKDLTEANLKLSRRVRQAVGAVRSISERLIGVQEEERRRIARDLHDGVGQAVTALQITLKLMRARPSEAKNHLAEAERSAEEILKEIRAAVFALRPAMLDAGDLEEGLRDFVERFELKTGIPASLRATGDLSAVSESLGSLLFRILQESLTNISRHAQAKEVGVTVVVETDCLRLEVSDDGRGFDPEDVSHGSGLRGIKERVSFAGGEMALKTSAGRGTQVMCRFPVLRRGDER